MVKQKRILVIFLILILSLFSSLLHADVEDGIAYMKEGKYEEAIEEFKESVEEIEEEYDVFGDKEAREELVGVYHWLATAYTKNNMPQKAEEIYKKILEISPLDIEARKKVDKVRRERKIEDKFLKMESAHFILKFEETERKKDEALEILEVLEEAYKKVGSDLNYYPKVKTAVIIYPSKEKYRYVTGTHYWSGGQYDGKIRVPLSVELKIAEGFNSILIHEYTHAVIDLKTKNNCPLWLHEGLAQYEDGEYEKDEEKEEKRMEVLTQSLEENTLVPLKRIKPLFQTGDTELALLAYYESYSVVKYLIARQGLKKISRLLEKLRERTSMDEALQEVFYLNYQGLEKDWKKFLASGETSLTYRRRAPSAQVVPRGEAETLFSLAQNYEMNKMYDLALKEYQKIIKNYSNSIWAQKARERIKTIDTKRR